MAILVSPDVDVESYFIGRHKLGVRDHRGPHFLDIPLACFLGSKEICPHLIRGRNLRAKDVPRDRKKYNNNLEGMSICHKMDCKLESLDERADPISSQSDKSRRKADFMREFNKWDKEFEEHQKACEHRCRKKKMGCLAFSKDVKTWVDRQNTLHWLKRYHLARLSGRKHKIKFCGLKRACRACELPHPSQTSLESVLGQMKMCVATMKKLAKKAPKLARTCLYVDL